MRLESSIRIRPSPVIGDKLPEQYWDVVRVDTWKGVPVRHVVLDRFYATYDNWPPLPAWGLPL